MGGVEMRGGRGVGREGEGRGGVRGSWLGQVGWE